jgi:phosphoribosylformylglycinamidine cyclo-ligase
MITYLESGVDIDKADKFIKDIKPSIEKTHNKNVLNGIGGFSGLFQLNTGIKNPVLVSSTDGVGTKLKLTIDYNKYDNIGIDLVAMCVNDIIVNGAIPLFFLDYLSVGKLNQEIAIQIMNGIIEGCKQANCALIGGETAEMPGVYKDNEYDLAGFVVGMVDKNKIIDGSNIRPGDKIIGLASNGLHSNGFSLVRKVLSEKKYELTDYILELNSKIGDELLKPTVIYNKITELDKTKINGIAHITGGGLFDNIKRILPKETDLKIYPNSWNVPNIFKFIQKEGNISYREMIKVFNNGIGMVLIVKERNVQYILNNVKDYKTYIIGEII